MTLKSIGILIILVFAATCAASDDKPLIDALAEYNNSLAEAYRTSDVTPLTKVAGPEDLRKVFALIDINKQKGIYLDSRLQALEVQKVDRPSADTARVWTNEDWEYVYKSLKDNAPNQEMKREKYELVYFMTYRDGRWWVERVKWKRDYMEDREKKEGE